MTSAKTTHTSNKRARLPKTIAGAKAYAKTMRNNHKEANAPITHAKALELTAHALGFSNWNIAAARLSNRPLFEPQIGDRVTGKYLKQDFTGEIVSVTRYDQGSHFQVSIHFDSPVDVVSFSSFSAYRQRVTALLDNEGICVKSTSDGDPHMTIFSTHSAVI